MDSGRRSPWEALGGVSGSAPLGFEVLLDSDHSPVVMQRGSLEGTGSLAHGPCELRYNSSDSGLDPPPWAQGV